MSVADEQARIDTAVGAIMRLLQGLPRESLELVRDLVEEALEAARTSARPPFEVIRGHVRRERK